MKRRAIVTTALATMLSISAPLYAGASAIQTAMPISIPINDSVLIEQQISHIYESKAEVLAVRKDGEQIVSLLVKESSGNQNEIQFNVFADTIFINNEDIIPANPSDITKGDVIYIYGSSAMTRSLPPQSKAYVVLTNLGNKSPARYIEAKEIIIDDKENGFVIDAAGSYNIHIEKGTSIIPYKTRQFVNMTDITEHSRILVWSEIMALSYPAIVMSTQVMLLPEPAVEANNAIGTEANDTNDVEVNNTNDTDSIIISTTASVFSINNQEVHLLPGETVYKNATGVLMVPVRSISEGLGYNVEWNEDSRSVSLYRGPQSAIMTIDSNNYGKQKMLIQLSTTPVIINNRAHVPVDFFMDVLSVDAVINESNI
jgi:hypothetical protein